MTWLVTGAGGQLGSVALRALTRAGRPALGLASLSGAAPNEGAFERADMTDTAALSVLLERVRPSFVLHAAAVSSVAAAHADPARARHVNAEASAQLAALAERCGARFVYVSTDMVFDGRGAPYAESAAPAPLSAYGRSKHEGEQQVLAYSGALVARVPLLYGVPEAPRSTTFLEQCRALREGRTLTLFHDEYRTPLALDDAARALIRAAESDLTGVLHVAGPERLSRLQMGELLAEALGVRAPNLRAASRLSVPAVEPRAGDLSLDGRYYEARFAAPAGRPMKEALVSIRDTLARALP